MRTRDKARIVRLFRDGWGVRSIAVRLWGADIATDYSVETRGTIESIIREALVEHEARAARGRR